MDTPGGDPGSERARQSSHLGVSDVLQAWRGGRSNGKTPGSLLVATPHQGPWSVAGPASPHLLPARVPRACLSSCKAGRRGQRRREGPGPAGPSRHLRPLLLTWAPPQPGAVLHFHLPRQLLRRELGVLPQRDELLHVPQEAALVVPGAPERGGHQPAQAGPQESVHLPGAAVLPQKPDQAPRVRVLLGSCHWPLQRADAHSSVCLLARRLSRGLRPKGAVRPEERAVWAPRVVPKQLLEQRPHPPVARGKAARPVGSPCSLGPGAQKDRLHEFPGPSQARRQGAEQEGGAQSLPASRAVEEVLGFGVRWLMGYSLGSLRWLCRGGAETSPKGPSLPRGGFCSDPGRCHCVGFAVTPVGLVRRPVGPLLRLRGHAAPGPLG